MRLYDSCEFFFGLGGMQFVEGFVVLSWSASLWVKKLWEFYPRMRYLLNFMGFCSIFSEVQKMNVAGSGGTNIRFVPLIQKRGYMFPVFP